MADLLEDTSWNCDSPVIGNASVNLAPKPHYGLSPQYTNFGISQRPGLRPVNNTLTYVLGLPGGLSIDAIGYRVSTAVQAGTSVSNGAALAGSMSFLKGKLSSGLSANYSSNAFEGVSDGSTLQLRTTHTVTVAKKHCFRLDGTYTDNNSNTEAVSKSFQAYVAGVGHSYSF